MNFKFFTLIHAILWDKHAQIVDAKVLFWDKDNEYPLSSSSFPKYYDICLVGAGMSVTGEGGIGMEKLGAMQKLMLARVEMQRSIMKSLALSSPKRGHTWIILGEWK